jgi:UDP-GlcNAc:undecaprenyl-phosphate GlcNAc-1-phosphate transferase
MTLKIYYEMIIFIFLLLTLNIFFFFKIKKISKFVNIFDKPDFNLKKHKFNTPLLGGIIMFINLFFIFLYNFFFYDNLFIINFSLKAQFSIVFLLLSFFLLGLFDDKYGVKPEKKIILSILFSILILTFDDTLLIKNIKFSFIKDTLVLNNFSFIFTIFCIIILINALNFYDGINGQSSIFFIICFSYLAFKSSIFSFYILIIISLVFVLILNLQNKIFMGDSGIYFTASILIIALIYEYKIFKSIEYADEIFLLLIIPGYDLLRLSITRILNGNNAFYGDRNHIHHMLNNNFSILISNLLLFILAILPIFLFSFLKINFFISLFIITAVYVSLIIKLKAND